jgi:hypothetical protein
MALIGAFLILTALAGLYLAWPLATSTDVGIGPGYVPRMIAFIQVGLGALLVRNGFTFLGEPLETWYVRPPLFILSAVTFFAFSIERFGLVISLIGLVVISCKASRDTTAYEILSLIVGAVLVSVVVFVKALGLSIGLWPVQMLGL